MFRGDHLLDVLRRLAAPSTLTAREKLIVKKTKRYMASHPDVSTIDAMLYVCRATKLVSDGTIDEAIQRAMAPKKKPAKKSKRPANSRR